MMFLHSGELLPHRFQDSAMSWLVLAPAQAFRLGSTMVATEKWLDHIDHIIFLHMLTRLNPKVLNTSAISIYFHIVVAMFFLISFTKRCKVQLPHSLSGAACASWLHLAVQSSLCIAIYFHLWLFMDIFLRAKHGQGFWFWASEPDFRSFVKG